MVYYAGRLIESLKLFYKSNRPHYLWVYRHNNPLGMLGEHYVYLVSFSNLEVPIILHFFQVEFF